VARRPANRQQFQRTDRVSEIVREVVALELERLGDERLELVTVTAVEVDNELSVAKVFYSALVAEDEGRVELVADALEETRWRIQRAVNATVKARRTPQIKFVPDEVLRAAMRIDDLLAGRQDPTTDT
jgi:ribosome-binding factor A